LPTCCVYARPDDEDVNSAIVLIDSKEIVSVKGMEQVGLGNATSHAKSTKLFEIVSLRPTLSLIDERGVHVKNAD
jgi:hypothetical protein